MTDKAVDLSKYRLQNAEDTLSAAGLCMKQKLFKDAVGYFNRTYVAAGIFSREIGKKLGRLKQERETSDYDDFYIASASDAEEYYETAKYIVGEIEKYLVGKGVFK